MKHWAKALRREALTLWVAARHPEVPALPKLIALLVAAYAFSPIDLIPDVIPVLGLVDDVLIVPAGVWLALKLVPRGLRAELRARGASMAERPVSRLGLIIIILLWLLIGFAAWQAFS
ncbi:YkvA family protein [Sphingomicrobium sediminis]|uniref:YkvA family protein n=1 Tax=Sphingomicrobium sediminis TaxID=2950949 RepID=A0A9X2J5Q7_9SPHN|nr:YkvA family protein [Sphingomicrobium sediminis]MCM8558492.1 YkvA family protein [Sphingomicrobium sediminis]